ncbi:hypothetical protein [Actinokineospora terrae]|uniref:von Willebrand factor type A domain-containing protein n=1 Tax=Actinokineospora terrae TaxID=155974 RepID=A0A1H9MNH5_9PSEU|nr:hypothetical protein [Actinokineospora terrae]SER25178.1 hypothetical protein SAMN04487818_102247 [Actinokineospora terrae]
MTTSTKKRRLLVIAVAAAAAISGTVGLVIVSAIPDYRTTVLVDTSAPGADFPAIADAVGATLHNTGSGDAVSVRRFGGDCGSADNTAELTDDPTEARPALQSLHPSGRATLLSGILAAVDDFTGVYPFRGSERNRIIVITTTGADACTADQAEVTRTIQDHIRTAGLTLDLRVIGHKVPEDQRSALSALAPDTTFTDDPAQLAVTLDELAIPQSPEVARIKVTAPPSRPPAESRFAFTTVDTLGVVEDGQVTAQADVRMREEYQTPTPNFTLDGRFAFAANAPGVTTIDVESGAGRTISCDGCVKAVPVGGSRIAWVDQANRLMIADLAGGQAQQSVAPVALPTVPPSSDYADQPARLQAGAEGKVLVTLPDAAGTAAYGGPEDLYLVNLDGEVRGLGTTDSNLGVGAAAIAPDGETVAYVRGTHGSSCEERYTTAIVSTSSGETRTPGAAPPDVDSDIYGGMIAVWYDGGGVLNRINSTWRCSPLNEPTYLQRGSHERLVGDQWAVQYDSPVLDSRLIGPGTRASITAPTPDTTDISPDGGTLYVEVDGKRSDIVVGALAIAVAGIVR